MFDLVDSIRPHGFSCNFVFFIYIPLTNQSPFIRLSPPRVLVALRAHISCQIVALDAYYSNFEKKGTLQDSNSRPLAPKARIMPLDQRCILHSEKRDFYLYEINKTLVHKIKKKSHAIASSSAR